VWELGTGGYGYGFADAGESHYIRVFFGFLDDTALSDEDWEDAAAAVIPNVLKAINEDAVEVYREEGDPGVHWVYLEMESAQAGTYGMLYVEETEGIMAMVSAEVPADEWSSWTDTLLASLKSFSWWTQAARGVLAARAPAEPTPTSESALPEPTATPKPPAPTPTESAGSQIPEEWFPPSGKASIVLVNEGSMDLVFTMANQENILVAHTTKVAIFEPGTHTYTASAPGFSSLNSECAVDADTIYYWYTDDSSWGSCHQIWP